MVLQIKRAGAVAIARAVCRSKSTFKSLALDENEISDTGIDNLKARLSCPARSCLLKSFACFSHHYWRSYKCIKVVKLSIDAHQRRIQLSVIRLYAHKYLEAEVSLVKGSKPD